MEDEPMGGSPYVSTKKVNSLETELKDHKKLFKDVVGKRKARCNLDALLALANAAVTVDSNIPPGGASNNPATNTSVPADVPTSGNVPTGSTSVPADVPTSIAPTGVSNKGKTPMVEEDITIKERTFKQIKDDRLGEQPEKMLHNEEQAQVKANASLSKTLLGDDMSKDNFPARMAALIKWKKQALAEKLAKERMDRPMTQGHTGWKEPSSKRQKSTEAPIPFMHEVPQSLVVSLPKYSGTMRKSLDDQTFIKVVSNEDSENKAPLFWSALVGWEVITTPLG
nr:JmjC domain-containing protein [Tanacetum cinerariifolium]